MATTRADVRGSKPARSTQDAPASTKDTTVSPAARWQWRTFPVFCAFVAGLLIASLLNRETDTNAESMIQYAALLGAGYIVAHLFVTNVIVAGRIKRRDAIRARGETPPEDFEDDIVYPDADEPRIN